MFDFLIEWFAAANIGWPTLAVAAAVLIMVYLFAFSGIAKTGNAKRFLGGLASMAFTYVAFEVMTVAPSEAVGAYLVNALFGWLAAAFAARGVELARDK